MKQELQDLVLAGEKVIQLSQPLLRGKTEITEVKLREPASGELRGLELFSIIRMDVNSLRQLVPRISDITVNEFDALSLKDLTKISSEISDFFLD